MPKPINITIGKVVFFWGGGTKKSSWWAFWQQLLTSMNWKPSNIDIWWDFINDLRRCAALHTEEQFFKTKIQLSLCHHWKLYRLLRQIFTLSFQANHCKQLPLCHFWFFTKLQQKVLFILYTSFKSGLPNHQGTPIFFRH